jgi:hypothetical protein
VKPLQPPIPPTAGAWRYNAINGSEMSHPYAAFHLLGWIVEKKSHIPFTYHNVDLVGKVTTLGSLSMDMMNLPFI